jgi:transcriptional regulator with XRE-family HTH domain
MRERRRTTIIVAGGALAIASVGYGLGTQADDGTAIADSAQTRNAAAAAPPAPPGFGNLADKLGVDASELRQALGDFHEREHAGRRAELAAALAKALGLSESRVNDALKALEPERGVLPKAGRASPRQDDGRERARRGHRGPPFIAIRQLATRLGVTRAELRKALRDVRPDGPREGWKRHEGELARFLADRFELDADKVAAALAAARPPLSPHGPGGPPDHPPAL